MESHMAQQRHLNNAPIVEAIIDIRVTLKKQIIERDLDIFKPLFAEHFPVSEKGTFFEGGFGVINGEIKVDPFKSTGFIGFKFTSKEESKVVQIQNNGFSFSKLKPYSDWNQVIIEAKQLWEIYRVNTDIDRISRVAVRFINQLDMPLPIKDFRDILTKPPDVPEGIPNSISSFLTRVVLHDVEKGISANVVQALEKSVKPNFANIILDIDVYKNITILPEVSEQIWEVFSQMHELKNSIFFGSITENTVRLFE
jgi:uncharacterized protein (TIGR04255 family)